jgi:hypothetical protein
LKGTKNVEKNIFFFENIFEAAEVTGREAETFMTEEEYKKV